MMYLAYVDAALYSIGISTEQLIYNVAERLIQDINQVKLVPWPPTVEIVAEGYVYHALKGKH